MKKLIWALLFSVVCGVSFASAQTRLFELKETPSVKADKYSVASVRESEIQFNQQNSAEISKLSFPFFDGKIYEAKHSQTETRAMDPSGFQGNR